MDYFQKTDSFISGDKGYSAPYRRICITDRRMVRGDLAEQIRRICSPEMAPDLRPDAVILREKDLDFDAYSRLADQIRPVCESFGIAFLWHTYYPKITGAGDAPDFCSEGGGAPQTSRAMVHFPRPVLRTLDPEVKSRISLIGASAHSAEEAEEAARLGADYITVSHIFPTLCKPGLAPRGLQLIRDARRAVDIPIYALGGVHPENIAQCIEAGADGICMMSEYMNFGQS